MLSSLCSLTNTARLAVYPDISLRYIQVNQPPEEDSACDSKGATRLWYSSCGRP